MIFDSTATKQIYETRYATFAKDFEGVTNMYRLRAKGAAKQHLVTVQSGPLIPDGELTLYFRRFGVVKKVVGQSYAFNHQINSGLRRIILLLNEDVEARDVPGFVTTSDGIRKKLFFQGKVFTVADALVNIPSIKAARLNRKMRSSNFQQNKQGTA